jgi:hypothetical protein
LDPAYNTDRRAGDKLAKLPYRSIAATGAMLEYYLDHYKDLCKTQQLPDSVKGQYSSKSPNWPFDSQSVVDSLGSLRASEHVKADTYTELSDGQASSRVSSPVSRIVEG